MVLERLCEPPGASSKATPVPDTSREVYETWYKMTVMLQSGLNIKPVITHRFHYTDFQKGFDAMLSGQCGKVVLDWAT